MPAATVEAVRVARSTAFCFGRQYYRENAESLLELALLATISGGSKIRKDRASTRMKRGTVEKVAIHTMFDVLPAEVRQIMAGKPRRSALF